MRTAQRARTNLAAIGIVLFGACREGNAPPGGLQADRVRSPSGQPGDPVYAEERPFWNLAQTFPSTAGFFLDPVTSDIVVSLTDLRDAEPVKAMLRSSLAARLARIRKRNPRADVVVRQATHTFLQLKQWRDGMNRALSIPGIDWLDLDEARNRVVLGVDPGTDLRPIRQLARDLGVPEEAVTFEVDGPAVPRLALTDSVRPIAGGTEIQSDSLHIIRKTCSLGFPALWNGRRGFVTASHCSVKKFALDSTQQYQPTLPLTHADSMTHSPIGFEVADYAPQPCPPTVKAPGCVYADAAVYQYTGDTTLWYLGHIARPTYGCAPGPCSPPNLQIGGSFHISATDSNIMQNDLVSLIGEASGWDQNYVVSKSCVNLTDKKTGYVLLCQEYANFGNADGDSGGPVLLNIFAPPDSNVTLGGVFWGATPNNAIFSPWSGVVYEYPFLTVN